MDANNQSVWRWLSTECTLGTMLNASSCSSPESWPALAVVLSDSQGNLKDRVARDCGAHVHCDGLWGLGCGDWFVAHVGLKEKRSWREDRRGQLRTARVKSGSSVGVLGTFLSDRACWISRPIAILWTSLGLVPRSNPDVCGLTWG